MTTKLYVRAPSGRLGIQVVDSDASSARSAVSKVSDDSPLAGKVLPGDQIIAMNGIDVRQMDATGISRIFQQQWSTEKEITISRQALFGDKTKAVHSVTQKKEAHQNGGQNSNPAAQKSKRQTSTKRLEAAKGKESKIPPLVAHDIDQSGRTKSYSTIAESDDVDVEKGKKPALDSKSLETQNARHTRRIVSTITILPLIVAFSGIIVIAVLYANGGSKENDSSYYAGQVTDDILGTEDSLGEVEMNSRINAFSNEPTNAVEGISGSIPSSTAPAASVNALTEVEDENSHGLETYKDSAPNTIPANDHCSGATSIPFADLPRVYHGSTSGATPDINSIRDGDECGVTSDTRGVWYTFVGNGKLTYIAFSNEYGDDARASLFSGSSCNALVCEDYYRNADLFLAVPESGVEYWLLVARKSENVRSDFPYIETAVGKCDYELSVEQEEDS